MVRIVMPPVIVDSHCEGFFLAAVRDGTASSAMCHPARNLNAFQSASKPDREACDLADRGVKRRGALVFLPPPFIGAD
jgi:hypothetical protein